MQLVDGGFRCQLESMSKPPSKTVVNEIRNATKLMLKYIFEASVKTVVS